MGYSSAQAKDFINKIAPLIKYEAKERGYNVCSTVIAQAIIESASGTSSLGFKYHNYFGMKCGSSWRGKSVNLSTKEEYTVGKLTTIKDNFRVYDDMAKGVAGYYDFINTKRYANLKSAKNYREYANLLKADGYATSSTYVNTLISTVNKYDLIKYDTDININKKTNGEIAFEVIDNKWGNGEERKKRLTEAGYDYKAIQRLVNDILKV